MCAQVPPRSSSLPPLSAIARAAGVTVPTVSKVLNGRSDVSVATRLKVVELLRSAGYTPPEGVVFRSTPEAGVVDLVIRGVEGSWANMMLSGVEDAVSQAGRDVVVTLARETTNGAADWADRLIARGCRGAVIALVTPSRVQRRRLAAAGVELVMLDPRAESIAGYATVGTTNWAGGYSATEYLLSQGHERIAVIGGLMAHRYNRARVDGYRSALTAAGLTIAPSLIREVDWTRAGAATATARLLALKRPPTAIFACSDRMASGVYDAARVRGLQIPRDLSVVGFDDVPEALWLTPALTTVRQPIFEMGATAAQILLRLLDGQPLGTDRVELSTSLIERDSTRRVGPAVPA